MHHANIPYRKYTVTESRKTGQVSYEQYTVTESKKLIFKNSSRYKMNFAANSTLVLTTCIHTSNNTFTTVYSSFRYSSFFTVMKRALRKGNSADAQVSPSDRPVREQRVHDGRRARGSSFWGSRSKVKAWARGSRLIEQKTLLTTTSLEEARKKNNTGLTAVHRTVLNQLKAGHIVSLRIDRTWYGSSYHKRGSFHWFSFVCGRY